jgi:hypothetical protein
VVVNVVDQPILATGSTGTAAVNALMCNGNEQTIHVTNPGTNSVKWYNGINAVIATDVPTYTFKITKDTTIKTQYQDPASKCFSDYASVLIKMVKAAFTMPAISVKQGGTLTMTNASKNATSYNWTMTGGPNDNQQFTSENPTFNFNNLGVKKILLSAITTACQDTTSKVVTVIVSGIDDLKNSTVIVYPNPFRELVNVDLTDVNKDVVLTIYNLTGGKVLDKEIRKANSVETIDMSMLPVGTYLMVLTTDKGTLTAKLKKE